MGTKEIVGIDVSKATVDVCIHGSQLLERFDNDSEALAGMLHWAFVENALPLGDTLFVLEHTGLYSQTLVGMLEERGVPYCMVPGLEVKRSLGMVRGKDDRVDARRMALYGHRLRDELEPDQACGPRIEGLKAMASLRKRMVRQRAGHKASLGEQRRVLDAEGYQAVLDAQVRMVESLSKEIAELEAEMARLIREDRKLKRAYELILSVKGVGTVTAIAMMVATYDFTKFKTWRKFASYCGIAPFPHRSGTSIRGRTKVSHLANKEIKSLLNMCALSAIQWDPETRSYYQRRTQQGRNEMSTLNIIRNKLVARIFAAVNRGTPYVDVLKYAS